MEASCRTGWIRWFRARVAELAILTIFGVGAGCAPPRAVSPTPAASAGKTPPGAAPAATTGTAIATRPAAPSAEPTPIPVQADDAQWGAPDAPVTLVEFSDIECPFCARAQPTVAAVEQRYGPSQLRVVFKHYPLPFHPHSRIAAVASRAVYELAGSSAFFGYINALYADQQNLDPEHLERTAIAFGVEPSRFEDRAMSSQVGLRVQADAELADRLGVNGTPHFFVNGISISGAVPVSELSASIDRELVEGAALRAQGVAIADISPRRTKINFQLPQADADEPAADTSVWYVPVDKAPRLGPDDALVTIVEFGDFQCPFCKRVQPTIAALRDRYGADVRIVFKHLPLPFHPRARPAATLAIEARKKGGDAGFWKAATLLYESAPHLEDADLEAVAKKLGLDWKKLADAIARDADATLIDADVATAQALNATGVPHFFVNGRRIVGAQPLEAFITTVDAELASARALQTRPELPVPRARIYDELMRGARGAPSEAH